ncbi:hypothetical protein [Pseudonocardia sp. TRM90224]|uniref:hypothetical protein n=1 Tax=Pseudonocardia sp. TRM90224 TaxID=2812678 RepID=UPI001E624E08|nr:hypothetical protein [Pseudonocardia sp. TRM90224]
MPTTQRRTRFDLMKALFVLMVGIAVFAAAVGVAVLLLGVDAVPQWMRTTALALGAAVVIAAVRGSIERWLDGRSIRLAQRYLEAGDLLRAGVQVQLLIESNEKLVGAYDPLTLRWTMTLAQIRMKQGLLLQSAALMEKVVDGQLSTLGAGHPDTQRTYRLLQRLVEPGGLDEPVEIWWRRR